MASTATTSLFKRQVHPLPLFPPSSPPPPLPSLPSTGTPLPPDSILFRDLKLIPVAILSAGPVGLGDGIGFMNTTLIHRLCRTDGVLLSPSHSATPLDAMYGAQPPSGEIWHAHTVLGDLLFLFVLAVDVTKPYALAQHAVWPRLNGAAIAVADLLSPGCTNGSHAASCVLATNDAAPLGVQTGAPQGPEHTFTVYAWTARLANG